MHLIAALPGAVQDGNELVDPNQSPADVLVISAADTEIAALAAARTALGPDAPSLRLAQLGWLQHPFAVDLYLDKTALGCRLVIVRILGGAPYWRYGLEQFSTRLREAGVPFAALPGDDKPDPELAALSSVGEADYAALWAYCTEGGPENSANFLRHARAMLGEGPRPEAAKPLLRAGYYWPGQGAADAAAVTAAWRPGAPVAALVFYRALLMGAGLRPIDAMIRGLQAEGMNPLPLFIASLKDPVSAATLERIFDLHPPSVVLNTTGFAVSSPDPGLWGEAPRPATPLDRPNRPVLQTVLASGTRAAWADGAAGLPARDIAMNVALPEVDGRVLTRAIAFKDMAFQDAATECAIPAWREETDRIAFTAALAGRWARLAATPPDGRRVALILANYPNRDGRLANGVGLDTPAATVGVLAALRAAGYKIDASAPETGAALMAEIQAGPTNWLPDRAARQGGARLSLGAYHAAWSTLDADVRAAVEARWGPPEADPFLGSDGFALSILSYGNAVVGVQPARGYNIDPEETYHSPDLVPPHNYFAFYIWLREVFGADAIVHMGKHGNLEWLPGKALALSSACLPEAVLGPIPHLYPFIVNDPGEGTQAKRRGAAVIV
ncbi:MAG: cobaltochelatase subunit CobN, partial [Pseudomonadota bacterium]